MRAALALENVPVRAHEVLGLVVPEGGCRMTKIKEAASEFLASRRVAVTGVSRNPKNHGSNIVYQRLLRARLRGLRRQSER